MNRWSWQPRGGGRKWNETKLLDERAFGRISEADSLRGFFPAPSDCQCGPRGVCASPAALLVCCLSYLESLLITLIKAPFSSFSLWLSAFKSGNILSSSSISDILLSRALRSLFSISNSDLSANRSCLCNEEIKKRDEHVIKTRDPMWLSWWMLYPHSCHFTECERSTCKGMTNISLPSDTYLLLNPSGLGKRTDQMPALWVKETS